MTIIRNRFFAGRLLTPEDLELEQEYARGKLKRHNRYLHGFGVVFGLEVSKSGGNALTIAPGLAIDCQGNEILVEDPFKHPLPQQTTGETVFLAIRYIERESAAVSCLPTDAVAENSRIEESCVVAFEAKNTNQRHRHYQGRWRSCGKAHALTIAKLRKTGGQWRIVGRYHPPRVS